MRWLGEVLAFLCIRAQVWRQFLRDRFRPAIKARMTSERPTNAKPNRLYLTVQHGQPAFGFMVCPCGCGETLHLRFFGDRRPRWSVSIDNSGRVSVEPSIWRKTGCGSHFHLRRGLIHWC